MRFKCENSHGHARNRSRLRNVRIWNDRSVRARTAQAPGPRFPFPQPFLGRRRMSYARGAFRSGHRSGRGWEASLPAPIQSPRVPFEAPAVCKEGPARHTPLPRWPGRRDLPLVQAVFIQLQTLICRNAAQLGVVFLGAGEIAERRAEGIRRNNSEIDLETISKQDRRFGFPFGQNALLFRIGKKGFHHRCRAVAR